MELIDTHKMLSACLAILDRLCVTTIMVCPFSREIFRKLSSMWFSSEGSIACVASSNTIKRISLVFNLKNARDLKQHDIHSRVRNGPEHRISKDIHDDMLSLVLRNIYGNGIWTVLLQGFSGPWADLPHDAAGRNATRSKHS